VCFHVTTILYSALNLNQFYGYLILTGVFRRWLKPWVCFRVVSCECACFPVPLAWFGLIWAPWPRKQILIKRFIKNIYTGSDEAIGIVSRFWSNLYLLGLGVGYWVC